MIKELQKNEPLRLLLGFPSKTMKERLAVELQELHPAGVHIFASFSKRGIYETIVEENINCLILSDRFPSGELSLEEIIYLNEERNINIILLLDAQKRGTKYMEVLYSEGIYNALFFPVNEILIKQMIELTKKERPKKIARTKYNIALT